MADDNLPLFPATGYVPVPLNMEEKAELARQELAESRKNRSDAPFKFEDAE